MTNPVLSQLNIYPLKSASGISLDNAFMEQRGLAHDRRWKAQGPETAAASAAVERRWRPECNRRVDNRWQGRAARRRYPGTRPHRVQCATTRHRGEVAGAA